MEYLLGADEGQPNVSSEGAMYVLDKPESPWGDYGNILIHGMSGHLPRVEGRIQLERTGPFLPPITQPGNVVVTDAVRRSLEQALSGLVFRTAIKTRIVRLHWHTWDRATEEPAEYPSTGEPEDYLWERPHDPDLAEQLGPLWELVPSLVPTIQKRGRFNRAAYGGQDLVRATLDAGFQFVSPRLMEALSRQGAEWLLFRSVS